MWDGMGAIDAPTADEEPTKPAIALAAAMIAVRPIDSTQRYDLQTRSAFVGQDRELRTRQWRLLSEIDVTSQRWRPSGRPIYNHIDPLSFRDETVLAKGPSGSVFHAAMPLAERPAGSGSGMHYPLARFEQEAFFDRPNIDAQTITQRLLPLPAKTVLEQHVWAAPSATYFRHRFTLRSRYAGALTQIASREVNDWLTAAACLVYTSPSPRE